MVAAAIARDRLPSAAVTLLALGAAVVVPAGIVREPVLVGVGLTALVAGVSMLLRLEWALLLFVALAPFEDWASAISGASVKLAGLVVFGAWGLRLIGDRHRAPLRHPAVTSAGLLLVACLGAAWLHPNGSDGVTVLVRYLSFIGAFVVLVDALRRLVPPARIATVFAGACTLASLGGLYNVLVMRHYRADGPLGDANDFAFFLVAAFPLALALRSRGRRRLWMLAAFLMLGTTAATLSRGAVLGLVAMGTWAFFAGHLRVRTAAATMVVVTGALALVVALLPGLVTENLRAKDKVADLNVLERQVRWVAAGEMTVDHPLLGLGPAGFNVNYNRYVGSRDPNPTHELDVAHQMYLEVSAELGLLGLGAFLAMLGFGFAGAYRAEHRLPRGHPDRQLAIAVQASLVGLAVAAVFLTEQYFLPVWLVPALGAGLDLRTRTARG